MAPLLSKNIKDFEWVQHKATKIILILDTTQFEEPIFVPPIDFPLFTYILYNNKFL